MPDLTIEIMQQCARRDNDRISVKGSSGNIYTVTFSDRGVSCTCPAYQFGRRCKHLSGAIDAHCDWHELFGNAIEQDGVCPGCGGPTIYVKVAV